MKKMFDTRFFLGKNCLQIPKMVKKKYAVAIRTAPVRRPPFAIRTGVSISSLVALVSVEFHSLGLGLATYTLISTVHKYQRFSVDSAAAVP